MNASVTLGVQPHRHGYRQNDPSAWSREKSARQSRCASRRTSRAVSSVGWPTPRTQPNVAHSARGTGEDNEPCPPRDTARPTLRTPALSTAHPPSITRVTAPQKGQYAWIICSPTDHARPSVGRQRAGPNGHQRADPCVRRQSVVGLTRGAVVGRHCGAATLRTDTVRL